MIPAPPAGEIPDLRAVLALAPDLAQVAQGVYDAWEVGEDGLCPERGEGGICDLIADAFIPVLEGAGVEGAMTVQAAYGENHIFVVALLATGVFVIDVPPQTYEVGAAYSWKKIPGVAFRPEDVLVYKVEEPMSLDEFEDRYRD